MAKMVFIYRQPADPEQFLKHYFNVHVPLALKLPGLISYDVSKAPIQGRFDDDPPFLIGTLTFSSMMDIKAAFDSELGRQCANDRKILAPRDEDSSMFIFDEQRFTP